MKLLGRVRSARVRRDGEPLIYFSGGFGGFEAAYQEALGTAIANLR